MKAGHAPSVTPTGGPDNAVERKSLRDLARIPLGASAGALCILALAITVEVTGSGPWLYLAVTISCIAFSATFLTGMAVGVAWKTTDEEGGEPNHAEWVRPLLDALTGIWLIREPGDDLEAAVAGAVESLATGVGLGETWAFLTDQSEDQLRLVAHHSTSPRGSQIRVPELAMTMARRAFNSRRPVESAAFPYLRRLPDLTHTRAKAVSALALPFRSRERIWGVLLVSGEPGCPLTGDQKEVVMTFSEMLAVTLEATLLYDEVRRNRDQMNALFQIAMDITSHLELEESLGSLVRRTVTLLDGFCGGVRLVERTVSGWEYGHTSFWPVEGGDSEVLLALEPQTDSVVEGGRPKVVDIAAQTAKASDGSASAGKATGVIVPMKWEGEVIGVLYVLVDRRGRPFAETGISLLNLLASQAAIAVENSRLYESCHVLAVTDPLTGLYNRRLFSEQLAKEASRSGREGVPVSIIVLDVDGLKEYNDSRGHHEGDKVLCGIADILRIVVRESDVASRYGGDEFAVLLPGASEKEALQVAERIRCEVEFGRTAEAGISVSVGYATYPKDARDAEDLMLTADRRLYAAKGSGRNRVCGSEADCVGPGPVMSLN